MAKYKVLVEGGVYYPDPKNPNVDKNVPQGKVAEDLPETSVPGLINDGYIELVKEDK